MRIEREATRQQQRGLRIATTGFFALRSVMTPTRGDSANLLPNWRINTNG